MNNIIVRAVSEREVGGIPVSIGTSLAIESLCNVHPDVKHPHPPVTDASHIWINLRTLYRNLYGSVAREVKNYLTADITSMVLMEEIEIIEAALKNVNAAVKVVYYVAAHNTLEVKFPNAKLKGARTDLQKQQLELEKATFQLLTKQREDIRLFDIDLNGEDATAFILTHHPIDLLSRYRFRRLALIESHTGAIKPPPLWYTKLNGGSELERIPFNRMSLQLFGDGVMFSPFPIKIRKAILELAAKHRWNSVTTKDKIIQNLKAMSDRATGDFVAELFK